MKKLLIQQTLRSLLKNGIFLVLIGMMVYACEKATFDETNTQIENSDTAQFTAKTDGAIMGSVIAPNTEVIVKANNSEKEITAKTNEKGELVRN